jgi:PAS domain S-box-containing protein
VPRHTFFQRRLRGGRPGAIDLLNGGLVLAIAFLARLLLPEQLSAAIAPPIYLITVIAAAWFAGPAPALGACVLGALLMPLPGLWDPARPWTVADAAALLLMSGVCLLAAALTVKLRRSLCLVETQRERYARVLDSVADAVLVTDEDGRLEYFNERAQILLGFDAALLGRPLDSIATFRAGREQPHFDPLAGLVRGDRRAQLPEQLEISAGSASHMPVSGSVASLGDGSDARAHAGHVICLHDVSALRRSLQARRDADAQVAEKQQLMQAIVDEIPAVVAYLDREGRCVLANRTAVLGGFSLRRQESTAPEARRHLLDEARIAAALRGESMSDSVVLEDQEHRTLHFAVQYQPHRREFSGRIDGAIVHAVDVTEGMRRQQALVESEQRFRRLAEASSAVILHLDARGMVLFETGWPAYVGPQHEPAQLADLLRAVHMEDRGRARRAVVRTRAGDRKVELDLRLRHASGQYRQVALRIVPLPADERIGPVRGRQWILGIRDIHERRRIERSLLQRSQELEALAESVPHLVWIADAHGVLVYLNRQWCDYTGLAAHDDWVAAFHPDDRAALLQRYAQALRSGEAFTAEVRLRAADGNHRWHVLRALPVGDDPATRRWYGAFTDIEDQKQAQDVLLRAQSKTQHFLATLSHELRNPLAVIATNAWLLVEGRNADRDGRLAQAIQRQAQQLQRMVDDLLDVSRITQGKIQLRLEHCDLNDIVRIICGDFAARAASQETRLECEPADAPVGLVADVARVRQIADNLVSNALKATGRGGRVQVAASRDAGLCVLRVCDNGAGIPAAIAERMFEPFVQDSEWRDRGLGLGLAVVSQLTALHGGEVRAGNAPGGGACFEVRLPPGSAAAMPAAPPPPVAAVAPGQGRVLVVDDVVDHANALATLLRASGFEADAVYSGDEAVRFAQHTRCDAVICDIGLPEPWNGHRVAEFLRRNWPRSSLLIAYSGLGTPADVAASLAAGFDAHLLKPTRPAEILARLRDGLAERREPLGAK